MEKKNDIIVDSQMENNFKDNLKRLRTSKGISQEKMASDLYVTRQTISKWENGNSYPDIDMLLTLSKYFDVTTDELITIVEYEKARNDKVIKKDSLQVLLHVISIICCSLGLFGSFLFYLLFSLFNFHYTYLALGIVSTGLFVISIILFILLSKKSFHYGVRKLVSRTTSITLLSISLVSIFISIMNAKDGYLNSEFYILLIVGISTLLLSVISYLLGNKRIK